MLWLCLWDFFSKNYFTEKILDCFATYTIPIYYGCPNIGDFFNIDGIIVFDTVDDLINKVNHLTEEDYYSRKNAMKDNYDRENLYKLSDIPNKIYNIPDPVGLLEQVAALDY